MNADRLPRLNLTFERLVFDYDADNDIAFVHLDGPRAAVTEEVDDGWFVRIADGAVAGLELHGVRRRLLSTTFFASVFPAAIAEMEGITGRDFFSVGGVRFDGSPSAAPQLTRVAVLLVGQAMARFERMLRDDAAAEFAATPV